MAMLRGIGASQEEVESLRVACLKGFMSSFHMSVDGYNTFLPSPPSALSFLASPTCDDFDPKGPQQKIK